MVTAQQIIQTTSTLGVLAALVVPSVALAGTGPFPHAPAFACPGKTYVPHVWAPLDRRRLAPRPLPYRTAYFGYPPFAAPFGPGTVPPPTQVQSAPAAATAAMTLDPKATSGHLPKAEERATPPALAAAVSSGQSPMARGQADAVDAAVTEQRVAEARAIVKEFATRLKGELQDALRAGGPVEAVAVCHARAPAIAQSLAEQHGWDVGRTSLKRRNADNAPDEWEAQMLREFEARKAAGEEVTTLEQAATVGEHGETRFRYMKAIPTEGVCLTCHGGDSVAAAVEDKIGGLYPDDMARGYQVGDLRGAFTLGYPAEHRE